MKFDTYLVFKFSMLVAMLSFDIVLLVVNSYFSVNSEPEIELGIKAVNYYGKVESFDRFSKICTETEVPQVICEQISGIRLAGSLLVAFICLDILVLIFYSVIYCTQYQTVQALISKKLSEEPSNTQKCVIKWSYSCKIALVSHPIIINLACGLWIELSHIERFSNKITLKSGVIILIVQCFFSLLVFAMFLWDLSSAKRKSARLKKTCENLKKSNLKSESIGSSIEQTPFESIDLVK